MNISTTSWKRNLARFLLDPFVKNNVDWNLITKKELINNLSKKKMFEPKFFDKEKNCMFHEKGGLVFPPIYLVLI